MKNFVRTDLRLSLCGLCCSLCPMHLGTHCPGCGGGAGNQSCAIARCGMEQGVDYCYQCPKYPCERLAEFDQYDSFVTHFHVFSIFAQVQATGLAPVHAQLDEKKDILAHLLARYNDGRRKGLFSIAVNLLPLADLREILAQLDQTHAEKLPLKERAALCSQLLQQQADAHGLPLKLRKKPK